MDTTAPPRETQKNTNPIEALSKDEIISKYKGLLNIAKKAKQAKDELTEENRMLKEALKRAAEKQSSLPAMQEMVQEFTEKNLILTEQVNTLKRKTKEDSDRLEQFEIENESLKRQLGRLSDENDDLLADVDRMEKAMQQVNALGNEQRKNLELLEVDIAKIKEAEAENSRLREQLVTLNEESTLFQQKYQSMKELNSEQRKKFNSLKDRFIDVHRKLKNLKECKCVLLETQHEYAASVSKWQAEIIRASQLLCGKMSSLQAENEQLKQDTERADNNRRNDENALDRKRLLLRIKDLERLSKIIKQSQEQQRSSLDVQRLLDKLSTIEKLAGIVKEQQIADKEHLAAVTREQQKNEYHSSNLNVAVFQAKLSQMQGLVQVIERERSNHQIQLQDLEAMCIELRQHNEDLLTRFHLKEQEHSELLAEMRELNEALKGRGDAISRLQEQHEAEVKRQRELETQLSGSQQATQEKLQIIEQLQGRVDELEQANADAQSDVLSTSTISRAEELSRLREVDEGYEEKYHKLRALAAKLKKKLQEQTQQLKEMDQSGAINLEALKLAQAQLQQDLNAARAENQKLKSKDKTKHSSVLNLEIEAAEKSLADVSAKLTAKSSELETVRESLSSKENTIVQLRKEIAILEEAKNGEAAHSQQLKEQIDRMQVQVKDAVHSKQQALTQNKDLEQGVEKAKAEAEQLRLQLAESAQQYESRLNKSTDLLKSRTEELEAQLASEKQLKLAVRNAERAHEDLQMEYTEYKLKAQAVLRKNQNKGTKEQELEDELNALRESESKLRASNEGRAARLAQLDGQLEALQQDNAELQKRSKELLTLVDELRQKNDLLTLENQRQLQFEHDLMQQHRQEIEKIDAGHREQLKQMEQKLEDSQQKQQLNVSQRSNTSAVSGEPSPEQAKIDFLLMDHETNLDSVAAGGDLSLAQLAAQRKISTASRRSHDFMPLDELLNTSMNQITSDTVTTISNFGRSVSQQEDDEADLAASGDFAVHNAQFQATKERLVIQESRVKHLTSLLAENEQDLAKLTQMNDMLKEELRRQERSEEREQHMHNSEYLKNVFLKFLTLNNADERQRLVPVLNTILRLSRNEMEMLNCVAKGQKVSTDGSTRGWTGFLTAWSGGGGGSQNNN